MAGEGDGSYPFHTDDDSRRCFLVFRGHCRAEVLVVGIPGSAAHPHQYANS